MILIHYGAPRDAAAADRHSFFERKGFAVTVARAVQGFDERHRMKRVFKVRRQGRSRAFRERLQSAHSAHKGVWKVVPHYGEFAPAQGVRWARGILGSIRLSRGIVEIDAHSDASRAVESFPLNEAVLMLGAEIVVVIGGDKHALGVAVIQDGDGLGGREICRVRVLYGARIDVLRIAEPRTDQIEVVDAVVEDF